MVWLYLPVSVGLNSEYNSPCHLVEPFVMSRGKPMLPRSLSRKWKKDGFMKRLSGLTLSPSTASLGLEKWISSVPDSLASLGVKPVNSKKPTTNGGFGMTSLESFARLDLNTSSWRMSQASLTGEFLTFLKDWPKSGSMLNGICYERRKLAQIIKDKGRLFSPIVPREGVNFPTPMASDGMRTNLTHQRGNPTLLGAVQMFPTPIVRDFKGGRKKETLLKSKRSASNSLPDSLTMQGLNGGKLNPQWVEWLMGWPIGWTDLGHVETESFHFKLPSLIPNLSKEPRGV